MHALASDILIAISPYRSTPDDRTTFGVHSAVQRGSRSGSISGPKSPSDVNPVDAKSDAINPAIGDSHQFSFDSETRHDTRLDSVDGSRGSLSFQSGQRTVAAAYGLSDQSDHRPSTISLNNYPKESSHVTPGEVTFDIRCVNNFTATLSDSVYQVGEYD